MATIQKTPAGSWKAMIRRHGTPPAYKTFKLKRDAEAWASQTESEISRGIYINRSEAERLTVEKALDRYLAEVSPKKSPKTSRAEKYKADHLRDLLGKYSLAAVTQDKVASYRDQRLKKASTSTVRLELALLSHLFTIAMQEWGVGLPSNPVRNIKKPTPSAGRERRLLPKEEIRLLEECSRPRTNPFLKPMVIIAIETAMRLDEIRITKKKHLDLQTRTVFVPSSHAKNSQARTVPLSIEALKAFNEALDHPFRPKNCNLVFFGEPGEDGKRRPFVITQAWARAKTSC